MFNIFLNYLLCLIVILGLGTPAVAQSPEFFRLLSQTTLKPGLLGYNRLRGMVPRISAYEAAMKFKKGKLILADASTQRGFFNEHIFGAISLPYDMIDNLRVQLPKTVEISLYCP